MSASYRYWPRFDSVSMARLALLLLPVTAPLVVAAVEATGAALTPAAGANYGLALKFLAGFAIIYLTASYLLFGQVLEE